MVLISGFFFFSCRRRHTRWPRDWSSDVCSSDLSALQWGILLWLGLGASGIGYLGWNLGARRVNTGQLEIGRAPCRESRKAGRGGDDADKNREREERGRRRSV